MTPENRLIRKNEFDGNLALGVRQFNLATGRDAHLKERGRMIEKAQLLDPSTGLLREELSISRLCPVCGKGESKLIFVKEGFRHLKCSDCGMVYVNPALKEERLHSFYQDEDSYTRVLLNDLQMRMDRKKFNYGLDLVEEYIPRKGRLLDVGCGPGTFLQVAKERGWSVQGLEFNTWCVQRVRKMEIDIIDIPFEKAGLLSNAYRCVTLWNVLEHVLNPGGFLRNIHQLLVHDGVLLILVPNIDSLAIRILHEKSAAFSGDVHINFFNGSTLNQLLEQVGFRVKECETLLTELGTINNYLSFEDPYFGEGSSVLDFLTPEYMHDHKLGYQLLVLGQKE
jgi:2-polyprenyl-3-methyl-5-hydroxy-6-metoxy-1,4-benzoquinol methylase